MPIQISCSAPAFVAQKSRKLLISVQISLFGASGMPTSCRLRVSSPPGSAVLTIQEIPNMWDVVTLGQVVQSSNTFNPNGVVTNFVAFPAFFDSRSPTTSDHYDGLYQVDLLDATPGASPTPLHTQQFLLSGDASAAQTVNVAFALDHGSSMATPDSTGVLRLDRLKAAFARGLTLLRPTDSVGVTAYGNLNCVPIAAIPCAPVSTNLPAVSAFGSTLPLDESLPLKKWQQMGLDAGRALSPTATVVLITDGVNKNPSGTVITPPTLPTSALIVAEEPHSPPACAPLIVSPGGHYAIAAPQALGEFAIEKLLTQVLIGLAGNVFIDDPQGSLKPGEKQEYLIPLVYADRQLDLIVFSNDAEAINIHVEVRSKSAPHSKERHCGDVPTPTQEPIRGKGVVLNRFTPAPRNKEDTVFPEHIVVVERKIKPDDTSKKPVRFNLLMVANTDLMLDAQVTCTGTAVGSELLFSAVLSECGHAWDFKNTSVWVELTHPDGFQQRVNLHKVFGAPGRYQATLRSFRNGTYTAHFIATGSPFFDADDRRFRRECVRSVAVYPPHDCCQPQDAGDCFGSRF